VTQDTPQTIATFYKFAEFPEYKEWKKKLGQWGKELNILGTMILAPEGINATISGSRDGVGKFLDHIREDPRFADLNPRIAESTRSTFYRLRIITVQKLSPWAMPRLIRTKQLGNMLTLRNGTP